MAADNAESEKIEQMRLFYEMFPYPNRPLLRAPSFTNQLGAHGAFASLLTQGLWQQAQGFLMPASRFGARKKLPIFKQRNLQALFQTTNRILLVGCGTDEPLLFRKLHPKNEIVCLELSKKNIEIAKKKLQIHFVLNILKLNFIRFKLTKFIHGEAKLQLQSEDLGEFDYIQCFGVLHHQPNPEQLLAAMAKKLKKGGVLRLMIYSYHGRRLERKIQKRYLNIWEKLLKNKNARGILLYQFVKLKIWQILNFFGLRKSTSKRFQYLGLSSNIVADALMHPSDPGLNLENIIPMAKKNNLKLLYCQGKLEDGVVYGFDNPLCAWERIVHADKGQNLLSNPLLIFEK